MKQRLKYTVMMTAMVTAMAGLSGCSTVKQPSQSVGTLHAAPQTQYTPAQNTALIKTEVVTRYIPVPVPGQLMPLSTATPTASGSAGDKMSTPGSSTTPSSTMASSTTESSSTQTPSFLTEDAAVAYAQKHSQIEPNSNDFFNAMTTYHFMPGAIYVVYTAPMNITDIMFAPGEKIISEAAGDTLRWQVSQTYSGQGDTLREHLLIKPSNPGLTNTMLVTTNQHVYHLLLKSTNNDTFMMSVQWNYPGSMVNFYRDQPPSASASMDSSNNSDTPYQLNLADLDFNYAFGLSQGQKPSWYPVRVFNDGRQTFIQFPEAAKNSNSLPVLFVANDQGSYGTMVNWHMHWPYLIADGVIKNAQLRSGVASQDDQVTVQIDHKS